MRTVFYLVQKEFLQIFRNKLMLPMLLVMPVVQTVLLSFAANYEVKNLALGVVDHDHSSMSRQLIAKFGASGYFKVYKTGFSVKEADADLARDRTDLILEIPPHFERDFVREGTAKVSVTANAINAVKAGLAIGYANSILRTVDGRRWTVDGAGSALQSAASDPSSGYAPSTVYRPPSTVQVEYSNWYNPLLDYKTFMVPGILGEIIALIICFLTALNIVRERELGTIEQLNVTPIHKWQFILGKLMPFWIISLVMMTMGLSIGWLIFRIPMLGNLWLVFAYTLVFAPCMLGIGFLISNFAESQQQAMFTAWFFLIIFILMCGLFTPVDSMPEWAQTLNQINPVKYFVEFMRLVLLKGASFADIRQNFFTVLGYALVVNGLAVWTYRKRV